MNLLAHFYLAGESPELRVGNFIGDAVKGSNYSYFPDTIAQGITMHREIDAFADNHPITIETKKLLAKYRHYSSVIIDIFYDHFLAKNWQEFDKRNLAEYSESIYLDLETHKDILPKKSKRMYKYMMRYKWLEIYATIDGIDRVLKGLSRRTIFKSKMEQSTKELVAHYDDFEDAFLRFFPDIIEYTKQHRI